MFNYDFRMASGTATILMINPEDDTFLIGIRGKNVSVYPGMPSLPGGFMEARYDVPVESGYAVTTHTGETLEQTARREVQEECGIEIKEAQLHLYHVCSDPNTDPRAHVINICYFVVLTQDQVDNIQAGDDLDAVEWWNINYFQEQLFDLEPMAFNHCELVYRGLKAYQHSQECKHPITKGWA
jgi:8-oxo-dGTP diphosphatase